jgi:anti-sigma regulatory factor (Ser/Thr protein kinase)
MCPERSYRLDPTPAAPRRARQCLYEALRLWDLEEIDSTADVLTSELVTNAVRHAETTLVLRLVLEIGRLRVEVEDGCDALPRVQDHPVDALHDAGYGLRIVERVADAWGCDETPTGKRVWFELPVGTATNA